MSKLLNLFSNRSIASKLAAMTIVGAICMALVATSVLLVGRNQLIVERTQKAQAIVDSVWQIAEGFQKAVTAGQMTDQEARARFLAVASLVWYENHTNYVFIYDYETGIMVANPSVTTLVGKDMRNMKDANGMPFASILIDIARQGGPGSSLRFVFLSSSADPTPRRQSGLGPRL
jgi:methyl-accepting chemotaxis protein